MPFQFKTFAIGLTRSLASGLAHRRSEVRLATLDAIDACVATEDPLKRKGAGTEAIQVRSVMMVGWRWNSTDMPNAGLGRVSR